MALIRPPWKPPPLEDGDPPPASLPLWRLAPAFTAALAPPPDAPAPWSAEVDWDPTLSSELVAAFDDERREALLVEADPPPVSPSGWGLFLALRARSAPAADATVVLRTSAVPRGAPTGWTDTPPLTVTIPAGTDAWIEVTTAFAPTSVVAPLGAGWLWMLWRDPTDAADTLVGDLLVARVVLELYG